MNRILVIDDDRELCALICRSVLREENRGRLLLFRPDRAGKAEGE